MTSKEQRQAERAARERRKRRDEHERQPRKAIAAQRGLKRRRDGAHKPVGLEPDSRYAYLTQSHD